MDLLLIVDTQTHGTGSGPQSRIARELYIIYKYV